MTTQPSYVLMPAVAPTEEMIAAYCKANRDFGFQAWMNLSHIWPLVVAARPHPGGELREAFAKVIDPDAFDDELADDYEDQEANRDGAREKADAIIALLNAGAPPVV